MNIERVKAAVIALIVAALLIAVGDIGASVFGSLGALVPGDGGASVFLLVMVTNVGLVVLPAAYIHLFRDTSIRQYVGLESPTRTHLLTAGLGFVATFVIYFTAVFIVTLLRVDTASNSAATAASNDPGIAIALIVASLLFIGPAEEFLYRGVVQSRLRETFSAPVAIFAATVGFAVMHAPVLEGGSALAYVAILFFVSLPEAYLYERTDNLVVPIIIHALYDFTLFSAILIRAVGLI